MLMFVILHCLSASVLCVCACVRVYRQTYMHVQYTARFFSSSLVITHRLHWWFWGSPKISVKTGQTTWFALCDLMQLKMQRFTLLKGCGCDTVMKKTLDYGHHKLVTIWWAAHLQMFFELTNKRSHLHPLCVDTCDARELLDPSLPPFFKKCENILWRQKINIMQDSVSVELSCAVHGRGTFVPFKGSSWFVALELIVQSSQFQMKT